MQALEELDVGGGDDLGVAAVTHDADGAVDELQLLEHLDQQPPGDRVAAARTQVVLGALEERGGEVGDLPACVIVVLLRSRRGCVRE